MTKKEKANAKKIYEAMKRKINKDISGMVKENEEGGYYRQP